MDINRANIEVMFQEFKVAFTEGFNSGVERRILDTVAQIVPSTGSSVVHAWLTQNPKMREWIGDRLVNNIESDNMTITNKKYENTIEIPREDIEDDQHGLYTPLARLMGEEAAAHPDELLVNELTADNNWGADAAAFFGTSRTYGSNTISNQTTNALSASTFNTAVQTMQSYLGHADNPLNTRPFALVVGPSNRTTAFDILENDMRATQTSNGVATQNPNKGLVMPVVSSRLVGTYANYWYLLGDVGGVRGVIYQQRDVAEFQSSRMNPNSDYVFQKDKFQMGTRARGRAFLSLPHLIYRGRVAA